MSRIITATLVVMLVTGCAWRQSRDPEERLQGSWRYEVAGYPVVVTFADGEASIAGHEPIAYSYADGEIAMAGERWRVSFPSRDTMLHEDIVTGTELLLYRDN